MPCLPHGNRSTSLRFLSTHAPPLRLPSKQLLHPRQRINLRHRLIRPQSHNPRKPQRKPALMPLRPLNIIERHLDHKPRLHDAPKSLIFNRSPHKKFRILLNLLVSQPRISVPNVQQFLAIAHRKCNVRQHFVPLPMPVLRRRHHHIQSRHRQFQLEPSSTPPPRRVKRFRRLRHNPFVPRSQRRPKLRRHFLRSLANRGSRHANRVARASNDPRQPLLPFTQRRIEQQLPILIQQIKRHEFHGNVVLHPHINLLSPQSLLQFGKRQRPLPTPSQNLSIENQLSRQLPQRPIQLRKLRHLIASPRKYLYLPTRILVHLRPNPIIFFLHKERQRLRLRKKLLRSLDRRSQHKPQRMKQPNLRALQPIFRSQPRRLPNVPNQEIRPPHRFDTPRKRPRNRLLHQTLFRPNPQISSQNLHNIFDVASTSILKRLPQKLLLLQRRPRRRELPKKHAHRF